MNKKATKRYYFNILNKCNTSCDFCCMSSNPTKETYLSFDRFKEVLDSSKDHFELQLEGGEPLLSPNLYLFLEYARSTSRCSKITISTNGILLNKHLQRLTDFVSFSKIPFEIKRSINYYLLNQDKNLLKKCRDFYLATEFIENFKVIFNVRLRKEDDSLLEKLKEFNLYNYSNIFYLQNYGKLQDDSYEKPFIVQNIEEFYLYSSDGKCFGSDLIARSEHEKDLK